MKTRNVRTTVRTGIVHLRVPLVGHPLNQLHQHTGEGEEICNHLVICRVEMICFWETHLARYLTYHRGGKNGTRKEGREGTGPLTGQGRSEGKEEHS